MALTAADLRVGIERIVTQMIDIERTLNAADSKLGDGDTGLMLRRLFEALAATVETAPDHAGEALRAYAAAGASATGSSLGTLMTTALLTAAKITQGRAEIECSEIAGILAMARDAMSKRGGAVLGDKTIIDSVDAAAQAIHGLNDPHSIAATLLIAARRALDTYRSRPCRVGRARMYAERSVGLDDPGMLAFFHVMNAALGGSCEPRAPTSTAPARISP